MLVRGKDQSVGKEGWRRSGVVGITVAASLVAGQGKDVVVLLGSDVRGVAGLIMGSCAVSVVCCGWCLLAAIVQCKHSPSVRTVLYLGWLDIDLYLGTGGLVLIVVDRCIADGTGDVALCVLPAIVSGTAE